MVKELQTKFIKTTMLVATLLLVLFLVALNVLNFTLSFRESAAALRRITEQSRGMLFREEGEKEAEAPDLSRPGRPEEKEDGRRDFAPEGRYFYALTDADGALTELSLENAGSLSGEQALALLEGLNEKQNRGQTGGYLYQRERREDGSTLSVFLDVSAERNTMVRILAITGALGVILWVLVLILVTALSRRAIRPIAQSIEKQRRFITDAGHEIKTPLAVILSNVDVQELHGGKSKWTENIRAQALRLSDLTKQMLTLAKMEEGSAQAFAKATFDASGELIRTLDSFRESAELKQLRVREEIEENVQLHFSQEQYRQVLELLLDNAVKYAKAGGELSVSLKAEHRHVYIQIANDCEQLPDCEPDRLFERFYRADASRSRSTGGSGIGLAVVSAIAQSAGGRATCRYQQPDRILFEVKLPQSGT